jgi:hypothetical protein
VWAVNSSVGNWVSSNSSVVDSALDGVSRSIVIGSSGWDGGASRHARSSVWVLLVRSYAVLLDQVAVDGAVRSANVSSSLVSVVAVRGSKGWDGSVVVQSASQRIVSS